MNRNLKIRLAEKKDFYEILELFESWKPDDWDKELAQKYYVRFFEQNQFPEDKNYVGGIDNRIITVIGYYQDEEVDNIYWLGWFYTHRDFKRQGYGEQMLDYIMNELKHKHVEKLYTHTSSYKLYKPAQALYLKKGFLKEGILKDFYEHREGRIFFCKHL